MTNSEKLLQHIETIENELDLIREKLKPKPFVKITNAYWENGVIMVEFEANVNIDLHYWYGDKVHEVEDYIDGEIDQSTGRHKIGVNEFDEDWNVQLISEEVESEPVNVGPLKKVDSSDEEEETDEGTDEEEAPDVIPVLEGKQAAFGYIKGVIDTGDLKRIYFEQRGGGDTESFAQTRYVDIVDGEFTKPKEINFDDRLSVFFDSDFGWGGFRPTNEGMEFFSSPDGINFSSLGVKFDGKLDTEHCILFRTGGVRVFGRANRRGWDTDEWRRGISYHKANSINSSWESRNQDTDPMDYFSYDGDLKPDFYQPSFRNDGSGEVVIFWRDESNKIERPDKVRITGPVYPVPAEYRDGKIHILSTEPAFKLDQFFTGSKDYDDITVYETGQIYTHPGKITYKDQEYRVIYYREEEHYRSAEGKKCGIYLVKEV